MTNISLPSYTRIHYETIDSTNLEAKRLIQKDEVYSDVIITAVRQTAGRGRLSRNWVSEEGNLFVSIVKKFEARDEQVFLPDSDKPFPMRLTPFITALAVGDAIYAILKRLNNDALNEIKYKWPNDILVAGKKISGILIESINNHLIIGVGINVKNHPLSNTKLPATSINEISGNANLDEILEALICKLDQMLQMDSGEILGNWCNRAYKINENVTVVQENKEIFGIYKGIDENGWLILETKEGKRELISFGDVSWI